MEAISGNKTATGVLVKLWHKIGRISDFPENGGACVLYKGKQIAVFNFTIRSEWYATQNMCPHRYEMALSRGIIGDTADEPKVACPFHKKSYSLKTGDCMSGDPYKIEVYPIKIENDNVYLGITEDLS
jgi:nitrite reductase (NADH) small subunit